MPFSTSQVDIWKQDLHYKLDTVNSKSNWQGFPSNYVEIESTLYFKYEMIVIWQELKESIEKKFRVSGAFN